MQHSLIKRWFAIAVSVIMIFTLIMPAFASAVTPVRASSITIWTKWDLNASFVHFRLPTQSWAKAGVLPLISSTIPGYKGATINLGRLSNAEVIFSSTRKLPDLKKSKRFTLSAGSFTFSANGQKKGAPRNNRVTLYFSDSEFVKTFVQFKIAGGTWTPFPGRQMVPATEPGFVTHTISMGDATELQARFHNGTAMNGGDTDAVYSFKTGTFTVIDGIITPGGPSDRPVVTSAPTAIPSAAPTATPVNTIMPATTPAPLVVPVITSTPFADIQPPTVPQQLALATPASGSVNLNWQASTDNVGVDAYVVYRNDLKIAAVNTTSYADSGFIPGSTYRYYVRAMDKQGNLSGSSREVTFASGNDVTAPKAPVLSVGTRADTSVTIQWDGAQDDFGIAIYEVYRDTFKISETKEKSYVDALLLPNKSYKYYIRAVDTSGNRSVASNELTYATAGDTVAPSAPSSLSAIGRSEDLLTIFWQSSQDNFGVSGYEIFRNGKLVGTTATTFYTDRGLKPGEVVNYVVRAYDASGNRSVNSKELMASTIEDKVPPSRPADLKVVSKTDSTIRLSWSPSVDNHQVSGYQIIRNGQPLSIVGLMMSFEDTIVQPSTEYTYTVRAIDASNNTSIDSNQVKVTSDAGLVIYYRSLTDAYMTYGLVNTAGSSAVNWTLPPGIKFDESEFEGYKKTVVKMGNAVQIQAAFNNGSGIWDNNNNMNYTLNKGVMTVADKKVAIGTPNAALRVTPSPTPAASTKPSPTGSPMVTASAIPTVSALPTATPAGNKVRVFYYTTAASANIHYLVEGAKNWTAEPGIPMKKTNVLNWYVVDIDLQAAKALAEAAFYVGMGAKPWDNNNGKNYRFESGTWAVYQGSVVPGVPVGYDEPTPTPVVTATPVVTPTPTPNPNAKTVTVYYPKTDEKHYMHYTLDGIVWTATPGVEMMKSEWNAYLKRTVDLGSVNSLKAAFNNGKGVWDNNAGVNYLIPEGVWTIAGQKVVKGVPAGTPDPVPTATPKQ